MTGWLMLGCLLKVTLVMGAAYAATFVAGRKSAAFRHQLWLLAIAASVSIPTLQLLLPEWHGVTLPESIRALGTTTGGHLMPAALRTPSLVVNAIHGNGTGAGLNHWLMGAWALGFLLVCLRTTAGFWGLLRMFVQSQPLCEARFQRAVEGSRRRLGIKRAVRLRVTFRQGAMPCTCGVLRPVIFLPADCTEWPDNRVQVVLVHELAHICRFDWLAGLLTELFTALYWFHPLAWVAWRKQKEESERACDDAVLLSGEDAANYATELLDLVRNARRSGYFPAAALAVARPTHLERRLTAMLDQTNNRHRPSRKATLLTTTAALLLLLPLAALHSAAQSPIGGLTGSVTDPRGAPVAAATVMVSNLKTHTREMTATDHTGGFQFKTLTEGEYELRILKPGFREHKVTAMLDRFHDTFQNARLEMGAISEQVNVTEVPGESANMGVSAAPTRLTVGGAVQAAAVVQKVRPVYPAGAKANHAQGAVILEATIGPDGVPTSLQVMNGLIDADLARAAVEAVSQWRYRPTLLNGQPIGVQTNVTVNFTLVE